MTVGTTKSIAVIGYGAMAQALDTALLERQSAPRISACLLLPDSTTKLRKGIARYSKAEDLAADKPDLVVECAGHAAISAYLPSLLRAGLDVAIASIGALCDDKLRSELNLAAKQGGARILPVAGAIGGLDLLRAARLAGLDRVIYRGIKPPAAWAGSPAERLVALDRITEPTTFFHGNAREAANDFPKNANVAAAIALAGIGLDSTRVELMADPGSRFNRHEIEASGAFGTMSFSVANRPLPSNPKTSHLAALSVEAAVFEALSQTLL